VTAADHPRLLSTIAGACAASSANIVDAQIFTTTDGLALDTIFLSRAFDRDEDELRRANKIALSIEQALRSEIFRFKESINAKGRALNDRGTTFHVPPEVSVDNDLSQKFTVVEVSCRDRPGLLYDVTQAFSELNLNIGSAHVATFGEKAIDVFYVTDLSGAKITAKAQIGTTKRKLLQALSDKPAEALEAVPIE
jgi:[protein-PII] uridylyltransferase